MLRKGRQQRKNLERVRSESGFLQLITALNSDNRKGKERTPTIKAQAPIIKERER